ncbi:MAG: nucleotidyltransferase domain-containing protein [Bacteroidetes bacterium]|nr:nucleotidyltransferase domain-containing protein [Bacteroidota bacterium]
MNFIEQKLSAILDLCKKYKVKTLYAFGSVLTDKFNDQSDIDLIVDFKRMPLRVYSNNYYDFKFSLEDMLKRPVDLLEHKAIRNPYFLENVNKHKKLIYGT